MNDQSNLRAVTRNRTDEYRWSAKGSELHWTRHPLPTRHDALYDAITMLASAIAGGLIVWAVMV